MTPLNGPLELSVRVVTLLDAAYPRRLDINEIVLLDHAMLNSSDLGGPPSVNPALPLRSAELAAKRGILDRAIQILVRAGLAEVHTDAAGVSFCASETAHAFVDLLESDLAELLRERADWAVGELNQNGEKLRSAMRSVLGSWSEEFSALTGTEGEGRA